jgi:hypothetical protein
MSPFAAVRARFGAPAKARKPSWAPVDAEKREV